jgi:hypothetical protein
MRRHLALVSLLSVIPACTDRDAPRPVPVPTGEAGAGTRPLSSRESLPPPAVDPNDPAEPGIPDLARLARYVFRTMQRHEDVCPVENPFRDRLHFAFEIEVKGGRMTRVALGQVAHGGEANGEGAHAVPEAQRPRELTAYAACLAPHLEAVVMAPAPADGTYEPVYSFSGNPAGRAAH